LFTSSATQLQEEQQTTDAVHADATAHQRQDLVICSRHMLDDTAHEHSHRLVVHDSNGVIFCMIAPLGRGAAAHCNNRCTSRAGNLMMMI
jgi:hypothetical protein